MRLDKFISNTTSYSRKDVRSLLKRGAVTINGERAKAPDQKVDEIADQISIDGKDIRYREFIYLMLHKPQGYLSATEDDRDPVVTDLVPEEWKHFQVFPVGRLDKDTEGLLLLTNDGHFAYELTSPKKNRYKRYFARLDKPAEVADIAEFAKGMVFQDFTARPAVLEIDPDDPCQVWVEIAEGKFHQVKRMCERVGKTVIYLKRVAMDQLPLDPDLPLGGVRELTAEEMNLLGF
ncbi:MAG: rRNA pseudouridine synthase [Lentisphaeria bacterium]|nr:rRNA pseudouridine synthase [Lentisphaeria bacterium]